MQMISDKQILEAAEPFGAFEYGDAQGHKRIAFGRAVIALAFEQIQQNPSLDVVLAAKAVDPTLSCAVIDELWPAMLSAAARQGS